MRIGELAKLSELPSSTIRFYEKQGLLPDAKRTAAGYRVENPIQNQKKLIRDQKVSKNL